MKSSKRYNSAYLKMIEKKRQDNLHKWVGFFFAIFLSVYLFSSWFGSSDDESSVEQASTMHPITEYSQGRSIEELDRLIDEQSSVKSTND